MKNKIVICTVIKLQKLWKILENKSRQESATEKKKIGIELHSSVLQFKVKLSVLRQMQQVTFKTNGKFLSAAFISKVRL